MLPNDHIKPYLVSSHVRWSFPALSDSIVQWQQQVGRLPASLLPTALAGQGFTAIFIDRNGYPDDGAAMLKELGALDPAGALIAQNKRYAVVDIRRLPKIDVAAARLPRVGRAAPPPTAGIPACGATTSYNLEWIGNSSAPFVRGPVTVGRSGEFTMGGWAIDQRSHSPAADVDIAIGGRLFTAFYGIDRVDVAKYFAEPKYVASGFSIRLPGSEVGGGSNTLSMRILASDRSCYYQGPTIPIVGQ
jgi:hypothetical protein